MTSSHAPDPSSSRSPSPRSRCSRSSAGNFGIDLVTKMMIYAIFALSLELLVGSTGLVCFGQAAFFGIGAYADGAAVAAGGRSVAAVAAAGLRARRRRATRSSSARCRCAPRASTSSWSRWPSRRWPTTWCTTRRSAAAPTASTSTSSRRIGAWLDLDKPLALYDFTLACLVAVFGFLALLLRSRFGRALAGIRVNEQRMRATGFSTYPYKLAAFVLSGAIAGLAGFLFAVKDGFVNPELLSWHLSGAVLIMIILGGLGHLRGALIGAFAFALLQEFFKSRGDLRRLREALAAGPGPDDHRQRGAAAARPGRRARASCASDWSARAMALASAPTPRRFAMSTPEVLLRGSDLTRRWGGLVAVDRVSLDLERGSVHAVIGTNGAGKSTLINMLSGEIPPSAGSVELLGQDVTAWTQPRRARAGLGRSYQRNTIYPSFTVFENCRLAAQARTQKPVGVVAQRRRPARPARSAARDVAARGRSRRPARPRRRAALARPEAPARDRDVPGHRARGAAARRAAGRHGRRGNRPHARAARRADARGTRSCWSSTTWTRCSASPTASR